MTSTATALTIVDRVEQSPAILMLDARATALYELLPDAAAAQRFRRVVIQAIAKSPALLECTPESVVLSVFEAAQQGLEPTGAAGGAHLVPYNVKVSKNPERWEKRAQLIPDYRGVVRLVTKPQRIGDQLVPSDVLSIEAHVVKEGDDFSYAEGSDAHIHHVPSLAPDRSAKATTHVYALARFRSGAPSKPEVMDRAEVERIRTKGRGDSFSAWSTDWDEMARKTVVKRLSKLLPVPPEVRSILVREDELSGTHDEDLPVGDANPGASRRVDALAQRLGASQLPRIELAAAEQATGPVVQPSAFDDVPGPASQLLAEMLRTAAGEQDDTTTAAAPAQIKAVRAGPLAALATGAINAGIAAAFGHDAKAHPTAAQVRAIELAADSLGPEAFRAAWEALAAEGSAS